MKAHGVFQHIPNKPSATGHLCDDMIILCHFPRMLRQGLEKLGYFFNWLGWFLGMHTEKWVGSWEGSCSLWEDPGKFQEVICS